MQKSFRHKHFRSLIGADSRSAGDDIGPGGIFREDVPRLFRLRVKSQHGFREHRLEDFPVLFMRNDLYHSAAGPKRSGCREICCSANSRRTGGYQHFPERSFIAGCVSCGNGVPEIFFFEREDRSDSAV